MSDHKDSRQSPPPSRLSHYQSKPGRAQADKKPHIRIIRKSLPILAIILTLVTAIWIFTSKEDISSKVTEATLKTIAKNELLNPSFNSVDSKNQPYTITAERAMRGKTNENLIILTRPVADIRLQSGRWVAVKAEEGTYNQGKKNLSLQNKINIYNDQGYTLETRELDINIDQQSAVSKTPVQARGPAGQIKASGLYGNFADNRLVFQGPATLTLYKTGDGPGLGGLQ